MLQCLLPSWTRACESSGPTSARGAFSRGPCVVAAREACPTSSVQGGTDFVGPQGSSSVLPFCALVRWKEERQRTLVCRQPGRFQLPFRAAHVRGTLCEAHPEWLSKGTSKQVLSANCFLLFQPLSTGQHLYWTCQALGGQFGVQVAEVHPVDGRAPGKGGWCPLPDLLRVGWKRVLLTYLSIALKAFSGRFTV